MYYGCSATRSTRANGVVFWWCDGCVWLARSAHDARYVHFITETCTERKSARAGARVYVFESWYAAKPETHAQKFSKIYCQNEINTYSNILNWSELIIKEKRRAAEKAQKKLQKNEKENCKKKTTNDSLRIRNMSSVCCATITNSMENCIDFMQCNLAIRRRCRRCCGRARHEMHPRQPHVCSSHETKWRRAKFFCWFYRNTGHTRQEKNSEKKRKIRKLTSN